MSFCSLCSGQKRTYPQRTRGARRKRANPQFTPRVLTDQYLTMHYEGHRARSYTCLRFGGLERSGATVVSTCLPDTGSVAPCYLPSSFHFDFFAALFFSNVFSAAVRGGSYGGWSGLKFVLR